MLKVSKKGVDLLYRQNQLKKLESGHYLKDEKNKNFLYIKEKFFAYETLEKAKLLNVGCGIFTTVPEVYSNYVGNPTYDFGVLMDDFVKDMLTLGFCVMGMERVDGKLNLVYEEAKNYRNDNGLDHIGRLYLDDEENMYMFVQTFGIGYIENRLYKVLSYDLSNGTEVSLDTIRQTKGMEQRVETGLKVPAIMVIHENCESMIEKIISMVYAIDRQILMNHTQYLQNLESFVVFKNIVRPQKFVDEYNKGNRIDFSKLGRIVTAKENGSIEFVNNVNSLIDTSIKDMDNDVRRISAITSMPIEFLGLDSNEGAVGQGSRTLRQGAFMKKIQYLRDLLDKGLAQYLDLAKLTEKVEYTRPDIFVKTEKELVEEIAIAREQKLISLVKAIQKYNGYTEDEALSEMEAILAEETPALPQTPPQDA